MASIGVALPITKDSADGFTMLKSFRKTIKQNFKMLILTSPGERVMEPEFGVGIRRFLFENYDDSLPYKMESRIREQVKMFMPVISISQVNFDFEQSGQNVLGLTIVYSIPTVGPAEMLHITI